MSVLNEVLPESLERVREFIAKHPKTKGGEVSIYAWPDVKTYGIRVAEVSLTKQNSGGSWMQSDPDSAVVCFFAERLALEYGNGGDDEDAQREIEDAEANLVYALYGADKL